jgi:hypothetical protein
MNYSTRAFIQGFQDGEVGMERNTYKQSSKRIEYENGFKKVSKFTSKKPIKKKPQQFDHIMGGKKEKIKIVIQDGIVQDIVRENTNCEFILQDYDLEGFDYDSDPSCKQDTNGNWYREIAFK